MATTSRPWDLLNAGFHDITGAAVASGKVRWYNPGTLVAAVAYADAACASPATAPLTLNAQGQGLLYFLEPVRVIVKDSTETLTFYDDIAPLTRHDSVYVTSPDINGGVETTLEAVLALASASLGSGFQYRESASATARSFAAWMGELAVSVKDFGAVGDGTTDDTTSIQAAYDRVKARGGGWVLWPKGTYKITAAITLDTAGVNTCGAGRGVAIVKNFGTTTNAFTVNLGSSIDSKMTFRDFSITASTTSSGKGILFTNGNRGVVFNVACALHRRPFDAVAVNEASFLSCVVESTDELANADEIGINLGVRCRAADCAVITGTAASGGLGIQVTTNGNISNCYIEKFSEGIRTGGPCHIRGSTIASSVTGINTGGAGACNIQMCAISSVTTGVAVASTPVVSLLMCSVTTATTGYSVTAAGNTSIVCCTASACTTSLSVSAAGSVFVFPELGGTTTNVGTSCLAPPMRNNTSYTNDLTGNPGLVTPDITGGKNFITAGATSAAALAWTIAAHATATLAIGDQLVLSLFKKGANAITLTWNAQYIDVDGSALTSATVAANTAQSYWFRWDGTNWKLLFYGAQPAI